MYTVTHSCGCTRTVTTKGYLEPSTVRFLANSRCHVCTAAATLATDLDKGCAYMDTFLNTNTEKAEAMRKAASMT